METTSAMPAAARLLLPRPALASCVFAGVERDTRMVELSDDQRFNYYPATPLPLISWVFEGPLHMVGEGGAGLGPPLPELVISGPQRRPVASWSPGPVHALSVAFYPEALARLLGVGAETLVDRVMPLENVAAGPLLAVCRDVLANRGAGDPFHRFEDGLKPLWRGPPLGRGGGLMPLMGDWVRALAVRAALSPTGRGVRQMQRRIKGWTGQSHRDLQVLARVEAVGVRVLGMRGGSGADLAEVAGEAGFADQSHMGRHVRRVTGLSPGRLDELASTHEAFWFYRLLGEEFAGR
jgi:AraC-like DNA-binding protein